MRTPKTIYIIHEKRELIGYDDRGRPIHDVVKSYHPIECDIEPFSNKLAETSYGVFVSATDRVFSKPSDLIKLKEPAQYGKNLYEITEVVRYDKHYETLLKKVGEVDE